MFRICRTLDVGRRICRTSDVGHCDVRHWMPDVGCRSSDMSYVGCRTLRCRTSDIRTSDVGSSDMSDVGCRYVWHKTKWPPKKKWPPRLGSKKGQIICFVFRICRTLDVGRRICRTSDIGRYDVGRRIFGRRDVERRIFGCRMLYVGYSNVGYRTSVDRNCRFWHKQKWPPKKKWPPRLGSKKGQIKKKFVFRICRTLDVGRRLCRTSDVGRCDARHWMSDDWMSVVGYVVHRMSDVAMSDVGYSDVGCCMSDIRTSDVVCRIFERRMSDVSR